ncbi:MAG: DUF429 domain-containing protein, partial [Candidatus Hydrogenedentes bacterium]|nr:DUF429 domain-containing protein [Candidatus Hydrogenedentota bacterium]
SRCVLHMRSREKASEENRRLTGRRISTQTWAIVPKIKEVDEFLRETPCARGKLREIHPEVLFCVLNKGDSMLHRKGLPEGFQERLCVLRNHFCRTDDLVNTALGMIQGRGAERDDILDALAAAVTARLGENGLTSIPASPEKDGCGLRMEMRVPKSHHKSKDK